MCTFEGDKMNNDKLCKWLKDNSSGIYKPAAEAAERIKELEEALFEITCLPSSREDEAHVMAMTILKKYT